MSFNFKNIKKHRNTTKIGIYLLVFAGMFFVWEGKAEWQEITTFMVAILGFMFYGDNKKNDNTNLHNLENKS